MVVIPLMEDESVTDRILDRVGQLPPQAEMVAFDPFEIDVTVHCHLDPGGCSEWDRIAYVWLCEDDDCESRYERGRWITPYSRPGLRRCFALGLRHQRTVCR